jgi:hypothetical protein
VQRKLHAAAAHMYIYKCALQTKRRREKEQNVCPQKYHAPRISLHILSPLGRRAAQKYCSPRLFPVVCFSREVSPEIKKHKNMLENSASPTGCTKHKKRTQLFKKNEDFKSLIKYLTTKLRT